MVDIFIQIVPKLVAAFLIMMIYIHLSGKGSLAPISTIDQVGNVVLGAIIGGTIYNPEVGYYPSDHHREFMGGVVAAGPVFQQPAPENERCCRRQIHSADAAGQIDE